MTQKPFIKKLHEMGACDEAIAFADGFRSLQAAWNACENARWMEWLLVKTDATPKVVRPNGCRICELIDRYRTEKARANAVRRIWSKVPKI